MIFVVYAAGRLLFFSPFALYLWPSIVVFLLGVLWLGRTIA